MNWLSNVVRPKFQGLLKKRETPDNLWIKCPLTGEMVFHGDVKANDYVIPTSDCHLRMDAPTRLSWFFDKPAASGDDAVTTDEPAAEAPATAPYTSLSVPAVKPDPLRFRDSRRYTERLREAKANTGMSDAIVLAVGPLFGREVVAAVQDFRFLGGSLGRAAGEAMITGAREACTRRCPYVIFVASGGARMQEGILSLMQMPRTTVAISRLHEARLPFIVVLTDPTTGGVTASYAMLGDIHIAEPGAIIGFAGPRVIEQTIRETLPEGFQKAEYVLEHGMIDMVVHRHALRETISRLCRLLGGSDDDVRSPVSAAETDAVKPDGPALLSMAEANGDP